MTITKNEKDVLLYFLKAGYSTRQLDKAKLGLNPKKSKGYSSWTIRNKYNLRNEDKHKLFIYGHKQALSIINQISKINKVGAIDELIKAHKPSNLKKYLNSHLLTDSEESLEKILSGETRNIIRNFFLPQKKIIGHCQYKRCRATNLDTCHFKKSRPEIFKTSASKFKRNLDGLFSYDLYKIFEDFLLSHKSRKSICFLCKEHHTKLDKAEKHSKSSLNKYIKNIEWNL